MYKEHPLGQRVVRAAKIHEAEGREVHVLHRVISHTGFLVPVYRNESVNPPTS